MSSSFFALLGIFAWVALAVWPAFIAKRKGYSFVLFFIIGVFLSFLIALIIAVALKDKDPRVAAANEAAEEDIERETGML